MSNLASLTAQREGLLKKIRAIEASCEGIEMRIMPREYRN